MSAHGKIEPGLQGHARLTVALHHTALQVGSGGSEVLATPIMVALMEAAAVNAVDKLLPEGQQTVGTPLDVRPRAATPVGMAVVARAELVRAENRSLTFR